MQRFLFPRDNKFVLYFYSMKYATNVSKYNIFSYGLQQNMIYILLFSSMNNYSLHRRETLAFVQFELRLILLASH